MKEYLTIRNTVQWLHAASEDIIFIEAHGDYSKIVMSFGEEHLLTKQMGCIFDEIENQLKKTSENFILVGRSLIINRQHLNHIDLNKKQMHLSDGKSKVYTINVTNRTPLKRLKELIENEQ